MVPGGRRLGQQLLAGLPVPGVVPAADAPAGPEGAGGEGEVALATQLRPGLGGATGRGAGRHRGAAGDEPNPGGPGPVAATAAAGAAQGGSQDRMRCP